MRLDFYYYSYQCPLNDSMIQLLNEYKDNIEIHFYDFSSDFLLAEKMNLFFPTLTVLNGKKRYYSPLGKSFLEQVSQGAYPEERPFLPKCSDTIVEHIIEPIQSNNLDTACQCCGGKSKSGCLKKKHFLENAKQPIYGFLHKDESGRLVGGAEYFPSTSVPYPIWHHKDAAFLTCLYLSDEEFDYKSAPLQALEAYLKKEYKKIIAVSDEEGVFPNGNLKFFRNHGYQDEGIIYEDPNYCRLHLMSKDL